MTGRPLIEPRTRLPGKGIRLLVVIAIVPWLRYENDSSTLLL